MEKYNERKSRKGKNLREKSREEKVAPDLITGTVVGLNTESSLIAYGIRARKCYVATGQRRRPLSVELC